MEYLLELLAGLSVFIILIYYYLTCTFDFWSKRGVPGPKPKLIFGTLKDVKLSKIFIGDYLLKECQKYENKPMFGIFSRREPILVVKDAEIIKKILIKDFSSFTDRGLKIVGKAEPLNENLFFLEPKRWRPLRTNLTPVFTSGKLKEMFYLLIECANNFEQYFEKLVHKDPIIECRELMAKFATDVIGVCAFGLKMNALDDDSVFRKYGRKSFNMTIWKTLKVKLRDEIPWLYELLWPIMIDNEKNDFFIKTMIETMEYRKKNNVIKHDLVDLLMEIRDNPDKTFNMEMTDTLLTAQAYVFFIAGFETSSSTICNALYELALNQSVQDKLREEILTEYANNEGSLTYEIVKDMKYLQKVFYETLRKYPPLPLLFRRSVEEYTFSETKITIPKNTKIWIPIDAIQRDSKNYQDPETFDPERFNEENIKQRHPSYFLSFGDGPRNCIGSRFASYQVKIALIAVLKNYKVEACDKTSIPLENNPRSPLVIQPKKGITLKFTKLS